MTVHRIALAVAVFMMAFVVGAPKKADAGVYVRFGGHGIHVGDGHRSYYYGRSYYRPYYRSHSYYPRYRTRYYHKPYYGNRYRSRSYYRGGYKRYRYYGRSYGRHYRGYYRRW